MIRLSVPFADNLHDIRLIMLTTHAVGIDLGTTYSCIAHLNEHGEPVTLPNQEGELSTPSVVLFDGDEVTVGTEALRNSIVHPDCVVQNSKRFMGDANHCWTIDRKPYTPIDVATFILKKLLAAAQEQIGVIDQAVITVPAQFSDVQRHATVEAGHRAGLQRVDIINEPVAAALCYVLGTEGLWFTELADMQRILVYDLGGGTFDLSLVRYQKNEVSVMASSGDLHLGGIDWNRALERLICYQFTKELGEDPRSDPKSLQALALEVEQTKRSLTVRPRTALTFQHAGRRKTYQIELAQFEKLTKSLVEQTADITKRLLKDHQLGWAHVDVVLTTGGASRMPMIRNKLKQLSGQTLNTALSPDLSIAHGATYYAGMLLTNSKFARSILNKDASKRLSLIKQQSVNARALGILVRDVESGQRFPHYLVKANTPLPAALTRKFGTVVENQRRVRLQIIESGTSSGKPPVVLGSCAIEDLPVKLSEGSEISVTISYDAQARVHVSAQDVTSGKVATTEIVRQENLVPQLETDYTEETGISMISENRAQIHSQQRATAKPEQTPQTATGSKMAVRPLSKPTPTPAAQPSIGGPYTRGLQNADLEDANQPVPLCNECCEPLDVRGRCPACGLAPLNVPDVAKQKLNRKRKSPPASRPNKVKAGTRHATPLLKPIPSSGNSHAVQTPATSSAVSVPPETEEIIELDDAAAVPRAGRKSEPAKQAAPRKPSAARRSAKQKNPSGSIGSGEEEFWKLTE